MSRSGCGAVSMTISQGKCCGTVSTTIFTSSVASWTRVKDSAMRPYGKSSLSHYKLLAALAGYAHSSLEPGHHRSAVDEGRGDGKEAPGKGETARSQSSLAAACPGPGEVGGSEQPQFNRCSTRVP